MRLLIQLKEIMEYKLKLGVNRGRIKLPGFVSDFAQICDYLVQSFGLYHQKIHVLSEMNKNIACSINLAESELGYSPEYSLENGMEVSLENFID